MKFTLGSHMVLVFKSSNLIYITDKTKQRILSYINYVLLTDFNTIKGQLM